MCLVKLLNSFQVHKRLLLYTNLMSHKKINFVIIGQPKSGTTALAEFLSAHPQICFSTPKEPGYFASDHIQESYDFHGRHNYFKVRTPEAFAQLFNSCPAKKLRGEGTTNYLYSRTAARNIYRHNPGAKIIIMLRNPVDFLVSLHMQYVNDGTEDETDFRQALAKEKQRIKGRSIPKQTRCPSFTFYSQRIKYAEHINRFLQLFPEKNILILTMEEFKENNSAIFAKVLNFLEVDTQFKPAFKTVHGSKVPRLKLVHRFLNLAWLKGAVFDLLGPRRYVKLQKSLAKVIMKEEKRKPLADQLGRKLRKLSTPEVKKLERLLGRDFSKIWGY